ncbi:streptophobe family protein [Streptomyces caniscabiei]|uniref:streptophobe family protein n=2 Tax=Streptomyces caniscabiei TaxID=2746961 RepID=UPI0029B16586|nr:streptophobe family protein [Streptomyces caniscabiei]MDX2950270.1 streptophobe family protein [Streptomyces caniscabiei]
MSDRNADRVGRVPWGEVVVSAIAAVSWALIGMAGVAALGLHLLEADTAGELGPMTAAVVALGAGGSVTPSGDVSVMGLEGAEATTAIEITPLGVSLVGALLLAWFFLRSLRGAGVVVRPGELLARAGSVLVLFVAAMGGLSWAGNAVVTLDGGSLGIEERLPGGGDLGDVEIPGLGDLGGGLLPDRLGDLADADARVGFTVDAVPTVLGGLTWCLGVLLIALLASRRAPLPPGFEAVHRVVRPAVSAMVTVLLVAVLAGLAAAVYAAIGDPNPRRIAGAALLGAPNGVWLGVPLGLLVPWDGRATGALADLLPDPLDELLRVDAGESVTLGRLAELDNRVWLLGLAAALMMLYAGVLTAVRTPFVRGSAAAVAGGASGADVRGGSVLGFIGHCALRLGLATAVALPLLVWATEVSVDASLAVFGIDAFDAGVELRGRAATAALLGALWGAGAGAAGALLACATRAAGLRASPAARGDGGGRGTPAPPAPHEAAPTGPYTPHTPYRPPNPDTNPYLRLPGADELRGIRGAQGARGAGGSGAAGGSGGAGPGGGAGRGGGGSGASGGSSGQGAQGVPDVYGAPTVVRRFTQPPRRPGQRPGTGAGSGSGAGSGGSGAGSGAGAWPSPPPPPEERPPPPPPPPPPPRGPRGR